MCDWLIGTSQPKSSCFVYMLSLIQIRDDLVCGNALCLVNCNRPRGSQWHLNSLLEASIGTQS